MALARIKNLAIRILSHKGVQRHFSNVVWRFSEQILRMIAGVVIGIWVARYLGPKQFGLFNYALAFVALFGSIAKLGLDSIVVRNLVHDPANSDVYLGTAFWLKFSGAFLVLAIISLFTLFTSNDSTTNLYIFIIAIGIVFQSFEVIDFYYQSKIQAKVIAKCRMLQLIGSSVVKVYLVFSQQDLLWFVAVTLLDQITLALSFYFSYHHKHSLVFYRKFEGGVAKRMLRESWPLIFSGVVVMFYMRIDQIMIKAMLGEEDVGLYSAALRLSEIWSFLPILITQSLFPAILSAKNISEKLYNLRLQRLYTFMVWVSITIAIAITLLSKWIVPFLYGPQYQGAEEVLTIHVWAGVFVSLGVVSSSWLISENMQTYALYRTLAGAVLNVVLNLILIPTFDIVGAAIATVISYMVAGLIADLISPRTRKMFYMKLNAFIFKGVRIDF